MSTPSFKALDEIWRLAGGAPDALDRVRFTGADPVLPSSFRVGALAQASLGAAALAAAEIRRLRGGDPAEVSVDMRHAAAEFRSERYLRVDGSAPADPWDRIAGVYPCGDGKWVRLHTSFPHHRDGVLALLDCAHEREAVRAALSSWQAEAFEAAAAERGLVVAMMRGFAEWDGHPQGRALRRLPVISIENLGEAPPRPLPAAGRPLGGVRVLDLTRIIAGPVAGRTLAAHGAEVMRISAAHLPSIGPLVIDTGRGKLSARLDLRRAAARGRLAELLKGADVFLQAYRPGALAGHGFGPEAAAALSPGIVYGSLSAYGHEGPWAARRGFDSLVQTASGFNHAEGRVAGETGPNALPCQALDHGSGNLLAFGVMMALARRAAEGGSWLVRVSLATTGQWLRGLGRLEDGFSCPDPAPDDIADLLETSESPFGRLTAVSHAGRLSGAEPHWQRPAVPLGSHDARWPD
jgi:crotonobetainyl-CoA:carnitine CoA-transferase CaiB-like acyl-CoA transferase